MAETTTRGYWATPATEDGPGVLVLHPWWGLNDTIKGLCDRLAAEGYVTYAPDLYGGAVATTIEEAERLSEALDEAQTAVAVAEAAEALAGRAAGAGLGVIGFSLGAYYALGLSTSNPDVRAVVVFYGVGPGEFEVAQAAYQGHFADDDPYEPVENQEWLAGELRDGGRPFTFHRYPGTGHWFFEPDRTDAYNAAAAELAWDRTLAFLREALAA